MYTKKEAEKLEIEKALAGSFVYLKFLANPEVTQSESMRGHLQDSKKCLLELSDLLTTELPELHPTNQLILGRYLIPSYNYPETMKDLTKENPNLTNLQDILVYVTKTHNLLKRPEDSLRERVTRIAV